MRQNIVNVFNKISEIGTRRISHALNLQHVTILRRLQKHYQHQKIDYSKYYRQMFFKDEAQFTRDYVWAEENSFDTKDTHSQHKRSIDVWCESHICSNKSI